MEDPYDDPLSDLLRKARKSRSNKTNNGTSVEVEKLSIPNFNKASASVEENGNQNKSDKSESEPGLRPNVNSAAKLSKENPEGRLGLGLRRRLAEKLDTNGGQVNIVLSLDAIERDNIDGCKGLFESDICDSDSDGGCNFQGKDIDNATVTEDKSKGVEDLFVAQDIVLLYESNYTSVDGRGNHQPDLVNSSAATSNSIQPRIPPRPKGFPKKGKPKTLDGVADLVRIHASVEVDNIEKTYRKLTEQSKEFHDIVCNSGKSELSSEKLESIQKFLGKDTVPSINESEFNFEEYIESQHIRSFESLFE